MADNIDIEILEDGTVSVTTDAVSGANHHAADKLMEALEDLLGGPVDIEKRKEGVSHAHRVNGRTIHHSH